MPYWNSTITNNGLSLLAKQVAGSTLAITKVLSGAYVGSLINLKEQTELNLVKQTLSIESLEVKGSQYTIRANLSNNGLDTPYELSQIGIYASDDSGNEILFAISQISETRLIPTPSDSPGFNIDFSFTFNNDSGSNVTITPELSGYVTREELLNQVELGPDITE